MADPDILTDPLSAPGSAPAPPGGAISPGAMPGPTPGLTPGWQAAMLPDDLKTDQTLSRFKDVGSLAKSYVELRKTVGDGDMVRVPKAEDRKSVV